MEEHTEEAGDPTSKLARLVISVAELGFEMVKFPLYRSYFESIRVSVIL